MIGGQARIGLLDSISDSIERLLPVALSSVYNVSVEPGKQVVVVSNIVLYGRELSTTTYLALTSFSSLLPMFLSIILGVNSVYASQMVAVEKVEKAFEMLLAQPIRRRDIVLAKIIGSSIASIIFGAVYLAGMTIMFLGTTSGATPPSSSNVEVLPTSVLTNLLGPGFLAIMALTLILGLVTTGALGVLIGSIVSDERIAGGLTAPVMFIFIGVGFTLMFTGISPDPVSTTLAGLTIVALPYTYVITVFTNNTLPLITAITAAVTTCLLTVSIAVTIFNRDVIVLGIRLTRRKTS